MTEAEIRNNVQVINDRIIKVAGDLQFITEARVIYNNTLLVNYVNLLYYRAQYNLLRGLFHASPGFFAILVAIWGVIVAVYNFVVFIIGILRIKEILDIVGLLRIIWPEFRRKYDEILGKISEFSQKIGWGVDGLIHLIQASQGGLNIIKGVTGKSFEWLQIAGAEKALRSLAFVSAGAHRIADDPSSVLDIAFNIPTEETSREVKTWWDKTIAWLDKTTNMAEEAVQKVNDTIDNLQDFKNKMPQFVLDHIPERLFTGLDWLDTQIDNTILPALTNISNEFTNINTELQAQRDRAQELANKLLLPGDLLLGVDNLGNGEKDQQERNIDDVTSRLYNREADFVEKEDTEIIKYLDSIMGLLAIPITPPVYTKIEDLPSTTIVWDPAEKVDRWFVGDF